MTNTKHENVFIETEDFFYLGQLIAIDECWVEMANVAIVFDTGQISDMLLKGAPPEDFGCTESGLKIREKLVKRIWNYNHPLPTVGAL